MKDIVSIINKYLSISKYSDSEVITPMNIVKDMVDLIPKEVFIPGATFFDPAVKSGRFLVEIGNRLMTAPKMIEAFPDEADRLEHILNEQLYGLATSEFAATIVRKALYDDPIETGNIYCLTGKFSKELVQGAFHIMQFDVVIGNPPYNKDIFLDFVDQSYQLSKNYVVMITPAKWQTDADDARTASKITYKQFRDRYVKHISHVVFYPECGDIFQISQIDGITFYSMDKGIHDGIIVENRCSLQTNFNSISKRCICNRESLINIGQDIIDTMKPYKTFRFRDKSKRWQVWTNQQIARGGGILQGTCIMTQNGNLNCIGISRILDSTNRSDMESRTGASTCAFSADTKEECEYFVSWLNTKFTRFFVAINISKLTGIICDDCFRFVPDPGPFDHIFTDDELYRKFGLRPYHEDYIKVIESVIRERK